MARAIWQKTVTDNTGAPSNGAQVTVNIQDGGPATIFSLQEGGTSIANPFVTGIDGIARFYAERGYYTVTVFKDNSSVSFPWNNLGDKNLFDDLANTAFVESTDYAQALLADEDATEALTTLGISDYAQTLLADEDATEARSTLGLGTAALLSPTAYAQSLLDDANATEARATLELGTAAVVNASTYGASLIDDADASAARTTLGLGTAAVVDASAYGASLIDDADATAARTTLGISTFGSSLIDDADASAARTTLGLGTAAVVDASAYGASLIDDADASAARTTLGLGTAAVKDVDNMGSLGFASGTEGNPSIARTNNAETGIFFPNNDQIGFSTSGVEKMRILSNGNIDIKSTQETALTIRNLALNASSNSGTTSIKLGDSSNSTKMISREKNATNISSINLFGEFGFGTSVKVYSGSNDSSTFFTSGTQRLQITFNGALILAGSTAQKASGTTWSNPSDIRLKKNITDYGKGIAELMQIRVCEWEFNGLAGTELGLYGIGVIADEAEEVLPKTVDTYEAKLNEDDEEVSDIKKFDATEITWLLVNSVKQHQLVIEQLTARLEALEGA